MKRTTHRRRSPLAASLKATAATLAIVAVTGGWAAFSVAARQHETVAATGAVEIAAANPPVATAAGAATTTYTYTTPAVTASTSGAVTETATLRTPALPTVTPTPPATVTAEPTAQPTAQPTPTMTATPAPTATAVIQASTESNTGTQRTRPAAVTRSSK